MIICIGGRGFSLCVLSSVFSAHLLETTCSAQQLLCPPEKCKQIVVVNDYSC